MSLNEISDFFTGLKWAFAGLVGAIIVARFHKDELSTKTDYVVFALSGACIAHFLGGAVVEWLQLSVNSAAAVGFLLGAFGGSIMQATVRAIKSADLWALVKNRFGGSE